MAGQPRVARTGLTLFFVAVLVATFFGPISALADTNLEIGGQARIAYANGDDVRLRESPGTSGSLISYIPEGSVVDVLDGPAEDDEGSLWYLVAFDGDTGYVISDYLALEGGGGGPAAGSVIGYATIAWTNNDGVRCRTEPSTGGAVITVVPEGSTVELTDAAFSGWQPINCGGQGGYVSTEFVSYEGGGAADPSAEASFGAQSATGTALVAWTNGDGVNCRSSASTGGSIITVIPEGSEVSLRGDARGDWQPVVCAGSNGYISTAFVDYDGSSGGGGGGGGGDEVTGTAYVDGTNGDGVRCRSSASMSGSIITVLPEGTEVSLRGGDSGGWQPVFCGGSQGYVSSEFLSIGDSDGGGGGGGGGGSDVTGSAMVTGTGNGLRCRASASFNADVISVYGDGDEISLRGNVEGEWQPVFCGNTPGYVYASYLDYDGSGGGGGNDNGGGGSNAPFVAGDVVEITGTNGDGVNLRSGAGTSSSVVMVVGEGQTASVISGSTGNWVAVSYSGTSGFIHMDYLGYSDGGSDDDDNGGGGGGIGVGERAMTLDSLNLRYDPSYNGGVAAVAPSGTVVEITGGRSNGFYAVDWDGLAGYMHGDYLTWTDEALSSRGGGDEDGGGGDDDGGGGPSPTGGVADFAMQYVGYPYVWGAQGPAQFDCSGFTYWVMLNALGVNIGRTTGDQINAGVPVDRSDLRPGDLVFHQNTYTWGLSHVGIYIGNNKFISAQNESTGVVVSDLNSPYYASRWYGARRVG